ncbi:hypothetical protein HID58_079652, partial [Brassica napus]
MKRLSKKLLMMTRLMLSNRLLMVTRLMLSNRLLMMTRLMLSNNMIPMMKRVKMSTKTLMNLIMTMTLTKFFEEDLSMFRNENYEDEIRDKDVIYPDIEQSSGDEEEQTKRMAKRGGGIRWLVKILISKLSNIFSRQEEIWDKTKTSAKCNGKYEGYNSRKCPHEKAEPSVGVSTWNNMLNNKKPMTSPQLHHLQHKLRCALDDDEIDVEQQDDTYDGDQEVEKSEDEYQDTNEFDNEDDIDKKIEEDLS